MATGTNVTGRVVLQIIAALGLSLPALADCRDTGGEPQDSHAGREGAYAYCLTKHAASTPGGEELVVSTIFFSQLRRPAICYSTVRNYVAGDPERRASHFMLGHAETFQTEAEAADARAAELRMCRGKRPVNGAGACSALEIEGLP